MENRNLLTTLFSLLCFWLVLSGCGTEEVTPQKDPTHNPGGNPSCDTLEPLVYEAPLTGGEYHCLWCNREWTWTIPANSQSLFVVIALTCERLRSETHLEIRDALGSAIWNQEIEQGESEIYCIRYEGPFSGALSVRLHGSSDLLLVRDLIEEFHGSVYLKVFNARGERLAGPNI